MLKVQSTPGLTLSTGQKRAWACQIVVAEYGRQRLEAKEWTEYQKQSSSLTLMNCFRPELQARTLCEEYSTATCKGNRVVTVQTSGSRAIISRHCGSGSDLEQSPKAWSQTRKRLAIQPLKDLAVHTSSLSQREHRQGSWFLCGCKWKLRLPRTGLLCKLLALVIGLLVVFHAASCGYFFCVQFPGARVLDFSRDIYDDFRDIYALAGKLLNFKAIYCNIILAASPALPIRKQHSQ